MTTIDLTTLIPRCHEAAKAKGFWDTERNEGEALMLVVSELGEAQEAHRKGRWASLSAYEVEGATDPNETFECRRYAANRSFEDNIKDTVEDELADAYIRICDFIGGFKIDVGCLLEMMPAARQASTAAPLSDNLGSCLLDLTGGIWQASEYCPETETATALVSTLLGIEVLCKREAIDLATHIDLKLAYNATRPAKHGKAY